MEKNKLDSLNTFHEAVLEKTTDDLFNNFPKNLKNATVGERKFRRSKILKEISDNELSVLFVDEIRMDPDENTDSSGTGKIQSILIAAWSDNTWKATHHHVSLPQVEQNNSDKEQELKKYISSLTTSVSESQEALKKMQTQLLHQEKLASLGQLSAGIAHEIKNPLNFINNFSEISTEYLVEVFDFYKASESDTLPKEVEDLLKDVQSNLERIHEHSTRVERIVKSMLMHSRGKSGDKEDTDLNALVKEYVNLSFHGMRANRNPINVNIFLDLDPTLKKVKINPEDFSRVILNLCNNAFDAMREKLILREEGVKLAKAGNFKTERANTATYIPKLKVTTLQKEDAIILSIEDNGPGVPKEFKDKLMMPFFTTKKAKEGTGLGLSITKGIIKDHKGRINLSTKESEFTKFTITLPLHNSKK